MAVMVVTYRFPSAAPSLGEMKRHDVVVVDVASSNGFDDDTTLTHNMGLSADGLDGAPEIVWAHIGAVGSRANTCGPWFTVTGVNTIQIRAANKGANDEFTVRVWIKRPHSLNR